MLRCNQSYPKRFLFAIFQCQALPLLIIQVTRWTIYYRKDTLFAIVKFVITAYTCPHEMCDCLHIAADLQNNTVMVKDLGKNAKEIVREKILITLLPSYYLYMLYSILKQSGKSSRLSLIRPKFSGWLSLLLKLTDFEPNNMVRCSITTT